jgi:phage terminase Nu1 subunit (DNA packaging protein)
VVSRGLSVSKKQCCDILGWTSSEFDRAVREGMPVAERPSGRGTDYVVFMGDVIRWLVEQALRAAGQEPSEVVKLDLNAERARLAKEQADKTELGNQLARKELLRAEDVAKADGIVFAGLRDRIVAVQSVVLRTGVPLALGSASLFGASTPLARMLSGSIDPWLLAGIQGIGGQIPAPSKGKPARAFFSRDCASATGGASGAGSPSRAHEPASISPKGSAASSAGTVAGSTGVPAVGTATPCAVAGQCNRSRHRAGFCRAQGEARRVPPPTRRRQNN